jgi:DNA polymerase-3 subunit epsilon
MITFEKLAYVDLETTGTRPANDRITEIAIVLVDGHQVSRRWSSLVNPNASIPPYIQNLTGITNEMVSTAPRFEELIDTIDELLNERHFVAHNARFDYGFLKNSYQRAGRDFSFSVLCTVKLSRRLYPEHKRHNLDSLLQRHDLTCGSRHRAMDDAMVLPAIVSSMISDKGLEQVEQAMAYQVKQTSLPPNLADGSIERLPEGPGVYLFYGEQGNLLYVGKSINIRDRVRSHFYSVMKNDREMQMAQQVCSIEHIETAGETGALLREAELIKTRQPIFNRRLRRNGRLYTIYWDPETHDRPEIVEVQQLEARAQASRYGLFRNRKNALDILNKLAKDHRLCLKTLGMETGKGPCFGYQIKKCQGACVGEESIEQHQLRLTTALMPIRIQAWPYPGAIGIRERHPSLDREEVHIIDHWLYLGSAVNEEEVHCLLEQQKPAFLDIDIYRILQKRLHKAADIIHLTES